jgi:hypothetical protein
MAIPGTAMLILNIEIRTRTMVPWYVRGTRIRMNTYVLPWYHGTYHRMVRTYVRRYTCTYTRVYVRTYNVMSQRVPWY